MSINWVMIPDDRSKPFIPLPRERAIIASPARTSFSLKSPKPPSTAGSSSSPSSGSTATTATDINTSSGIAYLTSQRVVYVPQPSTPDFRSFSVPLLQLQDTRVTAPLFGPNVLVGSVVPTRDGGIPTVQHPPYVVELRLTFRDGGAYDFHQRFCEVRERAIQSREIAREIGRSADAPLDIHGEQLPAYEAEGGLGAQASSVGGGSSSRRQDRGQDEKQQQQPQQEPQAQEPHDGETSNDTTDRPPPFSSPAQSRTEGQSSNQEDDLPPSYDDAMTNSRTGG